MSSKVEMLFEGTLTRNKVLEQIPGKALTLLKGIAGNAEIRMLMLASGYDPAAQKQGFELLEAAAGFGGGDDTFDGTNPSGAAINAVSAWLSPSFDRIQAALEHLHPKQGEYVFKGLANVSGVASVVATSVMLDRLDDLAGTGKGADARKATADEDKKAMATLAARGFDAKSLADVRAKVEVAHAAAATAAAPVPLDEQEARLVALKAWYDDWATTAHALIKKRSDLIKLGLAHRVSHAADPEPAPASPAPVPVPAAPSAKA